MPDLGLLDKVRAKLASIIMPAGYGVDPDATTQIGNPFERTTTGKYYFDQVKDIGNRNDLYKAYDKMDNESVLVAAALDVYSDNAISGIMEGNHDSLGFKIKTKNKKIEEVITMTQRMLDMDQSRRAIARSIAKYGDHYEELVLAQPQMLPNGMKAGGPVLAKLNPLNPATMEKISKAEAIQLAAKPVPVYAPGSRVELLQATPDTGYMQRDPTGKPAVYFDSWQVVHWTMLAERTDIYGVKGAVISKARRLVKQLQMVEDSLVIYRLTRAYMRYKYLVDTGDLPMEQSMSEIEKFKKRNTKKRIFDQAGTLRLENNPLVPEEDIYIPTGKYAKGNVDVLQGASNLGNINDILYFLKLLFASLKIPKAYFGMEEDTAGKHVIGYLDIQFARTVRALQQRLIIGEKQIYDTALVMAGISPLTAEYTIVAPTISTIDELQQWQTQQIKLAIAKVMRNDMIIGVSDEWVLKNLLGYTDEEVDAMELNPNNAKSAFNPFGFSEFGMPSDGTQPAGGFGQPFMNSIQKAKGHIRDHLADLKELVDWNLEGRGIKRKRFEGMFNGNGHGTFEDQFGFPRSSEKEG